MKSLSDNFDLLAIIVLLLAFVAGPEIRKTAAVQKIAFTSAGHSFTTMLSCPHR